MNKTAIDKQLRNAPAGQSERARPFLKWAGGKGQLLEKFEKFYPLELKSGKIKFYIEPFIGGGAVFLDIVQKYNIESVSLFDANEELILTYQVVQKNAEKLIDELSSLQKKYRQFNEEKQKEFYYKIRDEFNQEKKQTNFQNYSDSWIARASKIIFLNRTCFNGLFRLNSKGEFNVPAGRYKNPRIVDEKNLLKISELLAKAEIRILDFREIKNHIKSPSFVYFDPPYRPLNKTSSFTSYSKDKFEDDNQKELAAIFSSLNKKGIKLMLSNSDPKCVNPNDHFFDELYHKFHISRISARRAINSNAARRKAINEIVVTNYPVGN